jgi:hypothetical protein
MDNPAVVAAVTAVITLVLVAFGLTVWEMRSGRSLGSILFPGTKPALPTGPAKPSGAALRLLALLQREGRLVDFLTEDIQGYSDADIGAAVRDIHQKCQKALRDHLTLAPVLPQAENDPVEVPTGFDPSAVRLTGNVTGQPPFRGTLKHPGWRVTELRLAAPPAGQDEFVLMPAEVELP